MQRDIKIKGFLRLETSLACLMLFLLGSCKIGQIGTDFKLIKKDAQQISKDIKAVRGAFVPIDSLLMEATSGVLTELSNADSEEKLDTIAARINRILVQYLNESFKNLDPGPTGENLMKGAMRPVLDTMTERRLQEMIHSVSGQAAEDFTAVIRGMMTELTSAGSKAKLNALLLSLFTNTTSDSLSAFVNRTVADVDFGIIGQRIATELIEAKVKPQVDSVVRLAVRSIFDEIQKDKNARGFFSDIRNILILGLGLLGLIMAFLFWINRKKAMDLNKMFVHAIEDLEGKHAEDAKKSVEKHARARGLLRNVDRIMKKENLPNRTDPGSSGP